MNINIKDFRRYHFFVIRNYLLTRNLAFLSLIEELRALKGNPIQFCLSIESLANELNVNKYFLLDFMQDRNCNLNIITHHPNFHVQINLQRKTEKKLHKLEVSSVSLLNRPFTQVYIEGLSLLVMQRNYIPTPESMYIKVTPDLDKHSVLSLYALIKRNYKSSGLKDSFPATRNKHGNSFAHLTYYLEVQKVLKEEIESLQYINKNTLIYEKYNDLLEEAYSKFKSKKLKLSYFKTIIKRIEERYAMPQYDKLESLKQIVVPSI